MNKVILAYYINVGNVSQEDAEIQLLKIRNQVRNPDLIQYFVPIRNSESRIECLYPRYVIGEDVDKEMSDLIESLKKFKIEDEK
jgi:hypothetical protein